MKRDWDIMRSVLLEVEALTRKQAPKFAYRAPWASDDALNKNKPNNVADCLIAEAAFTNGHTLVTTDDALAAALRNHGGSVLKPD